MFFCTYTTFDFLSLFLFFLVSYYFISFLFIFYFSRNNFSNTPAGLIKFIGIYVLRTKVLSFLINFNFVMFRNEIRENADGNTFSLTEKLNLSKITVATNLKIKNNVYRERKKKKSKKTKGKYTICKISFFEIIFVFRVKYYSEGNEIPKSIFNSVHVQ